MYRFGAILLMAVAARPVAGRQAEPPTLPNDRARAVHLLNRVTYGPRPGDVDRVLAIGLDTYLDLQLAADGRDDPETARRLAAFPVTRTTSEELLQLLGRVQRERRARQMRLGDSADADAPIPSRRRRPDGPQRELGRHLSEFRQVALLRAVHAENQLFEIVVDFWTNHFNVFSGKGAVRVLLKDHIDEVIRRHALGKFEDLLIATAQSPAMLVYLDNATSVAPGSTPPELDRARAQLDRATRQMARRRGGRDRPPPTRLEQARQRLERAEARMPSGINENYARELLELHTLGVDGGYTQADVEAVARVFTGWSYAGPPRGNGAFVFNAWAHDRGRHVVLSASYDAGGMEDGLALLRALSSHPATMAHVSRKLCERFVVAPAPDGCVAAGVSAWRTTNGEIREVVRAILTSDDFRAAQHYDAKIKTPVEFIISAARALRTAPDSGGALVAMTQRLGQPVYGAEAPTGYPETQEEWVNSGALLNRVTVSLALASGNMPGLRPALDGVIPLADDVEVMVSAINRHLLAGRASPNTLEVLRTRAGIVPDLHQRRALMVGLALGSPDFQRQ